MQLHCVQHLLTSPQTANNVCWTGSPCFVFLCLPVYCHAAAGLTFHTSPWLYVGQKPGQQVHFKIIDYGHARLSHQRVSRKLPKIPVFEQFYQK